MRGGRGSVGRMSSATGGAMSMGEMKDYLRQSLNNVKTYEVGKTNAQGTFDEMGGGSMNKKRGTISNLNDLEGTYNSVKFGSNVRSPAPRKGGFEFGDAATSARKGSLGRPGSTGYAARLASPRNYA